jgi:hypothetical protein
MSELFKREIQIDPSVGAVEVKITARAKDEDIVNAALEDRGLEPDRRKIYFFDTPELELFEAGVVLRARLNKNDTDDSTVKLRPVVPAELSDDWKSSEGFEIEIDAVGENMVCSAKLTVDQDGGEIGEVAEGKRSISKLFSRDQERLIEQYGPKGIDVDSLTVLGPVDVSRWKVEPEGLDWEVTIERWVLPDRSDLVELSVKADPNEAGDAATAFLEFLQTRGLDIAGDQQTKTKAALRYFTTGKGIDG